MKDKIYKNKIKLLSLLITIPILIWNCKPRCSDKDPRTEVSILPNAKAALASFPQGTKWAFQCTSSSAKDTLVFDVSPDLPMDEGSCADKDCCSKYFYQRIEKKFQVISNSGLNNFSSYILDPGGFWLKGSWGTIPIYNGDILYKTFPGTTFNSTLTLTISGKTLTDIQLGGQYRDDNTPDYCYWSKQYGLVKYSYKTISGTIIKEYERIDLP